MLDCVHRIVYTKDKEIRMTFEWDENKNNSNKQKHGVSFETAARVFLDPNVIVVPDPFVDEERWDALGFVGSLLFVVYTERKNDTIRIISARKATKEEINGYKNNDFRRD